MFKTSSSVAFTVLPLADRNTIGIVSPFFATLFDLVPSANSTKCSTGLKDASTYMKFSSLITMCVVAPQSTKKLSISEARVKLS